MQELEEVARKVQAHREQRDVQKNFPEVLNARTSLIACYKKNKETPLDCWLEAAEFRQAVKKAEQVGLGVAQQRGETVCECEKEESVVLAAVKDMLTLL